MSKIDKAVNKAVETVVDDASTMEFSTCRISFRHYYAIIDLFLRCPKVN
ncbi:hypothetical protein [Bacillus sp. AFS077874]|nr:hypothetical protein [Bacillus sp. AFS077874]